MKLSILVLLALLLCAAAVCGALPQTTASPRMTEVTPDTGKAGTEFTASGENLTKADVAEVYLTDGKNDMKCEVINQQATQIKLRAPANIKPGRFSLMILTADRTRFLEQPVKVTIE